MPDAAILAEIDRLVDMDHLEQTLMAEGIEKFASPQKALLKLVEQRRMAVAGS
jgi:transaldolase